MPTIYHQLQGVYMAGDVMAAVDCARALPEYRHVFFFNHDENFDAGVYALLRDLGAVVRRSALIDEADVTPDLQAILYHCVGYDDSRRGEYVRFRAAPPGVRIFAWLQTPGLCGQTMERYNYLRGRDFVGLIYGSTFSLHNTPGVDPAAHAACAVVYPSVDAAHYAAIRRLDDGVFRVGRWSRGHDYKYSDDFLDLLAGIGIAGAEFICMGIPPKFRNARLPANVRLLENGAMPVEDLLARLDVLLFKTHAPAWHEGWCRTVTEAMAAGVVPVVENRGGLIDQVIHGYNGFLCDGDADYKRYCELLHGDPNLRRTMSANARATARDYLSLDNLRADLLKLIDPLAKRRLSYGSEDGTRPGFLNFDIVAMPGVDVAAPVDPFYPELPFADESFDEIVAYHVLEHVANKQAIIEEVWRIACHNALIKIKLPDRQHSDAFLDPAHLSLWEVDTIDFYLPGHPHGRYSSARFGLLRKHTTEREIYWELLAMRRRPPFGRLTAAGAGEAARGGRR